jgi:hypothetical protein
MADLLIAVGGTGQHVALAVSRLVFLGALPPVELATIDADDSQELSVSLKTFGSTVQPDYTRHPLVNGEKIYQPFDKTVREDPEFKDLFIGAHLEPWHRDIFDVCFDEVSEKVHVKDGMFGRPLVGATVFAYNKDTQLKTVFERIGLANDIFIAGSFVGGTGAGLIHQLVKQMSSHGRRIYGLLFLRWFTVPSGAARQTISDTTQDRNMRYGLDYFFRDTRPLLKATLLIGAPDHPPDDGRVKPRRMEPGKNDEKKHYFHLVAAYGLLSLKKIAITEQTDGSSYAAIYDGEHPLQIYETQWRDGRELYWYANRGGFVKAILDYVCSPKFRKEIESAFGLLGNPRNIGQMFYDAIKLYDRRQRAVRIDEVIRTLSLLSQQYQFALSWLDEVLEPLPDRLHHDRYMRVKDSDPEKAKELQKIWEKNWEVGVELPTPQEIAYKLHDLLVESFS